MPSGPNVRQNHSRVVAKYVAIATKLTNGSPNVMTAQTMPCRPNESFARWYKPAIFALSPMTDLYRESVGPGESTEIAGLLAAPSAYPRVGLAMPQRTAPGPVATAP